ncbi:hypothetical protein K474DRAFT_1572973, partial [Panus rudis PR-1116 ss-1]
GTANGTKRKAAESPEQSQKKLERLLTNSKSSLVHAHISDILSYENFLKLPAEAQENLCSLLPPTAFSTFRPSLDPTHPSLEKAVLPRNECDMDVDPTESSSLLEENVPERSVRTLDPAVFTSSFFQSAARTFQDHLYSSWLSPKANEALSKFSEGVQNGSIHAEWKDELWERDVNNAQNFNRCATPIGDDVDLSDLAKRSLIREGDVISYKRTFGDIVVEKDLLVHSIHPESHTLTLLLSPGDSRALPLQLLVVAPPNPEPPTLTTEGVMGSRELEDLILDTDERVSRALRHTTVETLLQSKSILAKDDPTKAANYLSMRAAKSLSIWRWRPEMLEDFEMQMLQERGGRELVGAVYYLR